ENRFDWWIMKNFNVLPTDERFLNLTAEQREFIWEQYLIDNPDLDKKIKQYDPDFEKEWEELGEVEDVKTDNSSPDDMELDIEKTMEEFLQERPDMALPEN